MFIKSQKPLLYKLALALECLMEASASNGDPHRPALALGSGPLTSLQKLQKLRRQSLAWRGELPSALQVSISVTRSGGILALSSGIFTLGDPLSGVDWSIMPGSTPGSFPLPSSFLSLYILPSLLSSMPQSFNHPKFSFFVG